MKSVGGPKAYGEERDCRRLGRSRDYNGRMPSFWMRVSSSCEMIHSLARPRPHSRLLAYTRPRRHHSRTVNSALAEDLGDLRDGVPVLHGALADKLFQQRLDAIQALKNQFAHGRSPCNDCVGNGELHVVLCSDCELEADGVQTTLRPHGKKQTSGHRSQLAAVGLVNEHDAFCVGDGQVEIRPAGGLELAAAGDEFPDFLFGRGPAEAGRRRSRSRGGCGRERACRAGRQAPRSRRVGSGPGRSETPARRCGTRLGSISTSVPRRPARTTEKTPPADSAGPRSHTQSVQGLGRSAVSGVLVVERPRQPHDAGQVLHVIAAEARVEARKHGSQTRAILRGMQVLLKQPVAVDSRTAADDDRRLGNARRRPSSIALRQA